METTTNKDLVTRFTIDKYAKKDDVRRDLNTSLIDPIWNAIKQYRSRYNKETNLVNLTNSNFFICLNPTLMEKINDISLLLDKTSLSLLNLEESEFKKLENECNKSIIASIGKHYGEEFNDETINSILLKSINNIQGISEVKRKAFNYFINKSDFDKFDTPIDTDYLVNLYIKLSGNENLVSIYRNIDFNKSLLSFNNEINGVSFNKIEKIMNDLFVFLNESKLSNIVTSSVAYFFVNFVKPFDSYNEEIALILFKNILASDDKNKLISLLSIEDLLLEKDNFLNEYKEMIRENDLTYIIYKIIDLLSEIIDTFNNKLDVVKAEAMAIEHLNELKGDEVVLESKEKLKEESSVISQTKELAIPKIETSLNIEEAKKFMKYLLEKNPLLKEEQAHFFVNHCTIGSYYTIQMYKNFEKVVYETARTSMDSLANFGYYRKEKIKNKFVYTPIKIEGK